MTLDRGLAVTSRASMVAWLACSLALGCGAEPVEARAIWVDEFAADGSRTIHVYDRGELDSFEVLGQSEPVERVTLDPRGHGVLVRAGDHAGAWFDLDDGRQLPLQLPEPGLAKGSPIGFAAGGLTWIDLDGSLAVVPLAWGLPLERRDDGTIVPLTRGAGLGWVVAAADAPIVLTRREIDGQASFMRFPTRADQPLVIALEAEAEGLSLPTTTVEYHSCNTALDCFVEVALEPEGALAMFSLSENGPWQVFDRRAPTAAGPLELPETLAAAQLDPGLRLLAVLDPDVSIWLGPAQLFWFDRAEGRVDNLPMFAFPPLRWTTADRGRAVILSSGSGPVYRADLAGLRAISLDSTECASASDPVVAPNGRFVAWTCLDVAAEPGADLVAQVGSGVVVRVSSAGLERFVGVPMATLAIDDAGDLLLYSVQSSQADEVDGVAPTSVPRNLFSLSGDGVLTRVDELEPAPAPVQLGSNELAAYIQGVAVQ